jgi:hypothetical protein
MAKPFIHSKSSAHKFKGKPSDYDEIHNMMDSSKAFFPDNRHRVIFHHSGGSFYMEKMFGVYFEGIKKMQEKYNLPNTFEDDMVQFLKDNRQYGTTFKNSDNKEVSVRDIVEQHCLEDFKFKFMPSAQDYIQEMDFLPWMQNGMGEPPMSHKKLVGEEPLKKKKQILTENGDSKITVTTEEQRELIDKTISERKITEIPKIDIKTIIYDGNIPPDRFFFDKINPDRFGFDDNKSKIMD